ncbi:MAG: translational GTPase TypA, partial [Proteobacteria bacterium]|nr:translational GTPase TypA [Pseudomonadota bacterium]
MEFRNVAVIAHVDHGKTTLIDNMIKQSGLLRQNQQIAERAMDSGELERERGITILAKCTSIEYQGIKINILDTPGHADFGGEVERVLSMVDGVILLVDAAEGPKPQTKFVLSKALKAGLKLIVVINKIDKPDSRPAVVLDAIFDLCVLLGASDEQLDFQVLYASGRSGWATLDQNTTGGGDLKPLFHTIVKFIPKPNVEEGKSFSMLSSLLSSDNYVGRILIGKIYSGNISVGTLVHSLNVDGEIIERVKLTKLFAFSGVEKIAIDSATAGDIIAIAGVEKTSVSDTVCDTTLLSPIPAYKIDPPTMSITIRVNNSPLAGLDGKKLTSRVIAERLEKEAESNISITLSVASDGEMFEVGGRGELQLGILFETMRREGFEFSISKPKVLFKEDENGKRIEPVEEVIIEVDEEYNGEIISEISKRKGEMIDMENTDSGKVKMIFNVPTRGMVGYQSKFRNDTRGTGIMNRSFISYEPFKGEIECVKNGALISNSKGVTTAYALSSLEDRGVLFVGAKEDVYEGMVIGIHSRENDLEVNPVRGKQLTNMRASGTDEQIKLTPHKKLNIEEAIGVVKEDEFIEITPNYMRIRKRFLSA